MTASPLLEAARELLDYLETLGRLAEDLVIYKLVAARPGDLVDVSGVVRRQGRRLDVDRIRQWGRAFAEIKEDPELLHPFEQALRDIV